MRFTIIFKFILLISLMLYGTDAFSQCISFARNIAKPKLAPFIHDGNYNATYIEEGESAELHKTFFEGEEYRLVVAAVESMPKLRIRIMDNQRNVIYDNADHQLAQTWDFIAKTTGALIVFIKVPDVKEKTSVMGGCVAILFGIKSENAKKR